MNGLINKSEINRAKDCEACQSALNFLAGSMQWVFSQLLISNPDWQSTRCTLSWKIRKIESGRLYPKLLATSIGNHLLPTVVAIDGSRSGEQVQGRRKQRENGQRYSANLCDLAKSNLLPTPTAGANRNSKNAVQKNGLCHKKHGVSVGLAQAVELSMDILPKEFKSWNQVPIMFRLLPTPTTREYKGGRHPDSLINAGRTATNSLNDAINAITGRSCNLNPLFISEMMGFPMDWILAPFQKSNSKHCKATCI